MLDPQELDSMDWYFDEPRIRSDKDLFHPPWEDLSLQEPLFLWTAILLSVGINIRPQRAVTKEDVERMRGFAYSAKNDEAIDRLSETLHRGEIFFMLQEFDSAPRAVQWRRGDQESYLVLPVEFFEWVQNQGWPIPSPLQAMLKQHTATAEPHALHTIPCSTTSESPQGSSSAVQTPQAWRVKRPIRSDTLRSMLHPILSEMSKAGEPIPNARRIMQAIEASAHPDFIFQDGSELKYLDSSGTRKTISADSLRKRVERMVVVVASGVSPDKN